MKRVCLIRLGLYPEDPRVRRDAEILESAGISVDIICLRGTGQPKVEEFGLVTAYRVTRERPKEAIFQYLRLSFRFLVAAFLKLRVLSAKTRYHVVQVHNMPDFLVFVAIVERICGKPVVLDIHDLSVELFQSKWGRRRSAAIPIVKFVEKVSCKCANHLLTASEGFKKRLVTRGIPAEKITLMLNAPDPHIFKFQPDRKFEPIERGAKVLYYGTVAERFGLVQAVESLARLQDWVPDSTLEIYGKYDPSYRDTLLRTIDRLGLANHVFLRGWLDAEKIGEIAANSDFGLIPYLSDDFMNLALSTKAFEYATMGLPFVASRLDPIVWAFGTNCVPLAEPGNASDFAGKIYDLCRKPDLRRSKVQQAREAVATISYEVMKDRYLDLVRGLMGEG